MKIDIKVDKLTCKSCIYYAINHSDVNSGFCRADGRDAPTFKVQADFFCVDKGKWVKTDIKGGIHFVGYESLFRDLLGEVVENA